MKHLQLIKLNLYFYSKKLLLYNLEFHLQDLILRILLTHIFLIYILYELYLKYLFFINHHLLRKHQVHFYLY